MADLPVIVSTTVCEKTPSTTSTRGGATLSGGREAAPTRGRGTLSGGREDAPIRGRVTLSGGREGAESRVGRMIKHIPSEELAHSMQQIKQSLDDVFASIAEVGAFELSEVKLGLEITAKGGFALIGSAEAGAKGAITLTFVPPKKAVPEKDN